MISLTFLPGEKPRTALLIPRLQSGAATLKVVTVGSSLKKTAEPTHTMQGDGYGDPYGGAMPGQAPCL